MSGRQAKQARKRFGITVKARREQAEFARVVAQAVIDRAERRAQARYLRRRVVAYVGLAAVATLILWGLFG